MRRTAVCAAGLAALASPVVAEDNQGLHLGVGLGDFSTEVDGIGDIDFDENDDASKMFAGWRFNRWMAVQLDYVDFGQSTTSVNLLDVEAQTKGLAASFVATLPLLGPVELFARAGVIFYDVEVGSSSGSLLDASGEDAVYGVGVGVTLLERLSLRAEYEAIDIDELDDAKAVWLTGAWRF